MTETLMYDPDCSAFTMDEKSWTYSGATAVCKLRNRKIGVIPFINPKNSNTPDTSFATMLPCVNSDIKP